MTQPASPGDQSTPDDLSDDIAELKDMEEEEQSEGSRLAVFLFLATLFGSLLGAAADLNDAQHLVIPVIDLLDPGPQLRITGSETMVGSSLNVAPEWIDEFLNTRKTFLHMPLLGKIERSEGISVDPTDSPAALAAAEQGEAAVIVVTEPLDSTAQQKIEEQGITVRCAAVVGIDIIAFVTHLENEDPPLTRDDISKILTGEITDWSQLGRDPQPINVFGDPNSAANALVLKTFTGSDEFGDHMIECSSDADCFDQALATRGSFWAASATWVKAQPTRYLNGIALLGDSSTPQDPLHVDFDASSYPSELIRPIYMYVFSGGPISQDASDLGSDFIQFVRSIRGQSILERSGYYTYFDPPAEIKPELPPGFGHHSGGAPIVCKDTQ